MKIKTLLIGLAVFLCPKLLSAQVSIDQIRILHEVDTVWKFGYEGINIYSRPVHRIDIAYPSVDPKGNPTELSGYVAIPGDVYSGEQPVDGIILYNHYTQLNFNHAPTKGYATGEDYVLANPLRPNYIIVCSDFYGLGITEGKGQSFCYGEANGQASIDCLLAARALLDDRGISQGKFLVNAGYSSGGYDAIAAQKVRDMKYKDEIFFDKTVVGGLPFDVVEAYNDVVADKDDKEKQLFGILMILDSYNVNGELGIDLPGMMKEPVASMFDEWMHSGKHSTKDIKDALEGLSLTDIVQDTLLKSSSPVVTLIKDAMKNVALEKGWKPDTTQKYFVFNLFRDETVPVNSCRALLNFLSGYDAKFKKSIVPEQTHLQTNFVIPAKGHTVVGGIVYYLNLISTVAAMPVLYYDGELNTHYADLVKDVTPMGIIHKLEDAGIDVKKIVKERTGDGGGLGDIFSLIASLDEKLEPLGITTVELLTMADDSGLSLMDILEIYTYLTSDDASETAELRSKKLLPLQPKLMIGTTDYYRHYLMDWLKENNVNIYESNKH